MHSTGSSGFGSRIPFELAGISPAARQADRAVRGAMAADGAVLIVAEAGFDPDRIAATIHAGSRRADLPLVRVDCADPPDMVLQGLFGGENGRDTLTEGSALVRAGSGSVFLADVDQMPSAAQARLVALLREGELPLAATRVPVRFRLIASSGPGLDLEAQARRFRPELYRRLEKTRVDVAPLRDRPGDLPAIIEGVLSEVCVACARSCQLAPAAMTALASLRWPGNLDQLRATLMRLVQQSAGDVVRQEDVLADLEQRRPSDHSRRAAVAASLREARRAFERDYIASVLEQHGWRMADAARALGIDRANLYRKARQLGIVRVESRTEG
jgi:two-component system nitrogen regulation response regulator NtrX